MRRDKICIPLNKLTSIIKMHGVKTIVKDMRQGIAKLHVSAKRHPNKSADRIEGVEKSMVFAYIPFFFLSLLFEFILPENKYRLVVDALIEELHYKLKLLHDKHKKHHCGKERALVREYSKHILIQGLKVFFSLSFTLLVDFFGRFKGHKG